MMSDGESACPPSSESRWRGRRAQAHLRLGAIPFAGAPSRGNADPRDFPFQLDAGMLLNPAPHQLAEVFDFGRGCITAVDQEITMHLRHLRGAIGQSAAAGGVDQLPSLAAGRIFESRAAGAALYRLRRFSCFGDFFHFGGDKFWIAAFAPE